MRIEEIQFENFRKYVDTGIKFKKDLDKDIHVVIAENGAGKTTFLNAMTWCLYNQEPKIKDKDRGLPTLNTEVSNNSEKEFEKASVTITVSIGRTSKLIIKRSDVFKIHSRHSDYFKDNNRREEWIDQEFSVTEIEGSRSNVYRDKEECDYLVSSFIPEGIKEFFFFDGEQLDNYFLISTAIKDQVFKLSHIYVDVANIYFLKSEEERYDLLKETYEKLEKERDTLMDSLGNTPSIKKSEEKRNKKIEEKEVFIDSLNDKKQALNDNIIKEAPKILARDAFINALKTIEENKDDSYIYPIEETILNDSINDRTCKVCDRKIDDNLVEILRNKKAKLYLISPEDKIISDHKKYFNNFSNTKEKYLKTEQSIQKDINTYTDAILSLEKEIKELYETVELNKHLKKSIDRRDELVRILPDKKSELDSLKNNNISLKKKVDKLNEEYLKLLSDEEEYKDILAKIKLCGDALKVINDVKEDMMAKTRKVIEKSTNEKFFNLIRKSQSFGCIKINDEYQVNLYDEEGREASSTASASEVELLALSFILAIHSVSGFESPLVVDTLLARTSGQQRLNVSQSCLDVSEEKQLLLFLLEEEYSAPVQSLFKQNHVLEYALKESESEKQIEIKEME